MLNGSTTNKFLLLKLYPEAYFNATNSLFTRYLFDPIDRSYIEDISNLYRRNALIDEDVLYVNSFTIAKDEAINMYPVSHKNWHYFDRFNSR